MVFLVVRTVLLVGLPLFLLFRDTQVLCASLLVPFPEVLLQLVDVDPV